MGKKSNQARFPLVRRPAPLSSSSPLPAHPPLPPPPQARIKKMIQADEEVGKVAAATPIVVCASPFPLSHPAPPRPADPRPLALARAAKALELFLASLVDACVKDAESRGSKKLTPYGLCVRSLAAPLLSSLAS